MRHKLIAALAVAAAVAGSAMVIFMGGGPATGVSAATTASAPASPTPRATDHPGLCPAVNPPGYRCFGGVVGPNPIGGPPFGWSFTEAPRSDGTLGKEGTPVCRHVHLTPFACHLDPNGPLLPTDPNNPLAP